MKSINCIFLLCIVAFQAQAQETKKMLIDSDELMKTASSAYEANAEEFAKEYVGNRLFREVLKVTLDEYVKTKVYLADKERIEKLESCVGMEAKVNDLKNDIAEQQKHFEEMKQMLATADSVKDSLAFELVDFHNRIQQKNEEIVQLNRQFADSQAEIDLLKSENARLSDAIGAFSKWKDDLIAAYNDSYSQLSGASLSAIDTANIMTVIKSVELLDLFSGKDTELIKTTNKNLTNLISIINVYTAGERLLKISANKTAVANVTRNINSILGQTWSPAHQNELRRLSNTLNEYTKYIDNFTSVLQMVENIQNNPDNNRPDLAQSLKADIIKETKEAINIRMALVADSNYPASYLYLNQLLSELRNSLSQFPKANIQAIRDKLNR